MAWYTRLSSAGRDLYPALRACLDDPATVARDPVRFEILRHFGYFVTESSQHMAEYVPYFLKSDEERARLGIALRTAAVQAADEDSRQRQRQRRQARADAAAGRVELRRSHEYAARILHAIETDTPTTIHGNVANDGWIPNLPDGCCVEVPCRVDGAGVQPQRVDALPPQCAALCQTNINMQGLTARAILDGRREPACHAAMLDPNTAAHLSLPQIRRVVDRLFEVQADLLPHLDGGAP